MRRVVNEESKFFFWFRLVNVMIYGDIALLILFFSSFF